MFVRCEAVEASTDRAIIPGNCIAARWRGEAGSGRAAPSTSRVPVTMKCQNQERPLSLALAPPDAAARPWTREPCDDVDPLKHPARPDPVRRSNRRCQRPPVDCAPRWLAVPRFSSVSLRRAARVRQSPRDLAKITKRCLSTSQRIGKTTRKGPEEESTSS